MKASLVANGPLSIIVNANDWNSYTGGIGLPASVGGCSGARSQLDHAVQLVGYDDTGSTPYWKVRNSWTGSWGENGFIRLPYGSNYCGVADQAMYVTTRSVGDDVAV